MFKIAAGNIVLGFLFYFISAHGFFFKTARYSLLMAWARTRVSLVQNNDQELHQLIIDELILLHVMGAFHPKFLPEPAGGHLLAFLKPEAFALFVRIHRR